MARQGRPSSGSIWPTSYPTLSNPFPPSPIMARPPPSPGAPVSDNASGSYQLDHNTLSQAVPRAPHHSLPPQPFLSPLPTSLPRPPFPPFVLPPFPPRAGFQPSFDASYHKDLHMNAISPASFEKVTYPPPHMRGSSIFAGSSYQNQQQREYHSGVLFSSREPLRSPQPFVIPQPPADYVALSRESPVASHDGQKIVPKLLILDLNGALVYRKSSTAGSQRKSFPRPYLQCFLDYLFLPGPGSEGKESEMLVRPWEVFVWSSAQPHNVRGMVESAFGKTYVEGIWDEEDKESKEKRIERGEGRLLGVWARDKLGLSSSDYNRKVQTVKDLRKISEHLDNRFDMKTIVLLDDSPLKAVHQPWSQIVIPEYDKTEHQQSKHAVGQIDAGEEEDPDHPLDRTLLAVIGVLEALRYVENVPAWVRRGNLKNDDVDVEGDAENDEINFDTLPSHQAFAHWYKDPEIFKHWTKKGEEALKRKNIEIRHGIVSTETGDAFHPVDSGRSPNPYRARKWSPSRPSSVSPDGITGGLSPLRLSSPPPLTKHSAPEWWNRTYASDNDGDPTIATTDEPRSERTGTSYLDFDSIAMYLEDMAYRRDLNPTQSQTFRTASQALRDVNQIIQNLHPYVDPIQPLLRQSEEIELDDEIVTTSYPTSRDNMNNGEGSNHVNRGGQNNLHSMRKNDQKERSIDISNHLHNLDYRPDAESPTPILSQSSGYAETSRMEVKEAGIRLNNANTSPSRFQTTRSSGNQAQVDMESHHQEKMAKKEKIKEKKAKKATKEVEGKKHVTNRRAKDKILGYQQSQLEQTYRQKSPKVMSEKAKAHHAREERKARLKQEALQATLEYQQIGGDPPPNLLSAKQLKKALKKAKRLGGSVKETSGDVDHQNSISSEEPERGQLVEIPVVTQ